jgi:predicted nucleic acid-binding protein
MLGAIARIHGRIASRVAIAKGAQLRSLHQHRGVSFWDAMIIGASMQTLYSEDLPGGEVEAGMEIVNPFQ